MARRTQTVLVSAIAGAMQLTSCSTPASPVPDGRAANAKAATRKSLRKMGETTVRITSDSSGRVASVEVLRSAGSVLDANTINYVRKSWRGPPNATHTVTFDYQMR